MCKLLVCESEDDIKRNEALRLASLLRRTVNAGVGELLIERRVDVRLDRMRGEGHQQNNM